MNRKLQDNENFNYQRSVYTAIDTAKEENTSQYYCEVPLYTLETHQKRRRWISATVRKSRREQDGCIEACEKWL